MICNGKMGAKDSKRSACLSYEDAVKRMSDIEYKRVCEAFKRLAGPSALLNKSAFIANVLGDGVPSVIAEWLYGACGGSAKGISQRDLICGLVLLTRGTEEEKVRFLWSLYSNEGYNGWIQRVELEKALRLEGADHQMTAQTLGALFGQEQSDNRVGYEQFQAYLSYNKEATILSRWLLICLNQSIIHDGSTSGLPYGSPDGAIGSSLVPTFYQSLAGVTHLHERDIADLEKAFWAVQAQSPTLQLDRAALMALVSPPVPAALCQGLFFALDENQDGHVDFKELCCGISAACRGPKAERMKFCFKIFDVDRDNHLNSSELEHLYQTLSFISPTNTPQQLIEETTTTTTTSLQDFLMWAIAHEEALDPLLQLLFEVGHVSLGLRPQCRHLERDIVLGWRNREQGRGYRVGQYWYLIGSEWWQNWLSYTSASAVGGAVCLECGGGRQQQQQVVAQPVDESNYGGSSASSNQSSSTDSMGDLLLFKSTNNNNNNDTASLASSSGVSSGSNQQTSPKFDPPGPIDNSPLLSLLSGTTTHPVVPTLTGEGGRLRTDITLCEGRDFTLVPDSLWKAMAMWYGGTLPLPRQVIVPQDTVEPELELYPLNLRILRHQQLPLGENKVPGRYLAHTAAFSRLATVRQVAEFLAAPLQRRSDEVRLWLVKGDDQGSLIAMDADCGSLETEEVTLDDLGVKDGDQLLLEVRNVDLTWPEELGALSSAATNANSKNSIEQATTTTSSILDGRRATIGGGTLPAGATGLHNLGNTCFMNAALQTLSNTRPLTLYFLRNTHLSELNTVNPMGSRGQVARRYAELIQQLWQATAVAATNTAIRSVAPLKLRWCVTRHAPDTLGGGGQHDSQELLAWLLDQLHEDLNRVKGDKKVYRELKDSGGRPDEEVAAEAWRLHSARDASIITDLFYGQLKSKVTCEACKHESVRFDAFNVLSLPLPMENYALCEVLVLLQQQQQQSSKQPLPHNNNDQSNHRVLPIKYGIRLPLKHGVAKVRHLKRHLHRLCGVPAHRLLVTVLAQAQIHQLLLDDEQLPLASSTKMALNSCVELVAFELPAGAEGDLLVNIATSETEEDNDSEDDVREQPIGVVVTEQQQQQQPLATRTPSDSAAVQLTGQQQQQQLVHSPEVRASSSALCMPNILCFKTTVGSRGVVHHHARHSHQHRSTSITSPIRPFTDQPNNSTSTAAVVTKLPPYLVAVHRKTLRQETYFLHQQRSKPSLFGMPMLLACNQSTTTGQDLYEDAWTQVARLLSPAPPLSETGKLLNHATDCDDSLGYEFPFSLKAVLPGGQICALCHWTNFCRGCAIPCCPDTKLADLSAAPLEQLQIAIDWDPTALHLRYQSGREKEFLLDESLFEARRLHTEPIDLDHCLRAFTQEERLEAKYHCGGCKSKQPATKKLQIWRLPPILIIHLKRFDRATCMDKWVKTHKVVNFPFDGFDPTAYLAAVPQQTILRHRQLQLSSSSSNDSNVAHGQLDAQQVVQLSKKNARERLESTSLQRTPIQDEHLHDFHQHHLLPGQDAFDLRYKLYAVVSHSGMMTGGHYVSYAHNPNGHWYCYNDSACREVALDHLQSSIDPSAAYLLFYERKALDYRPYLPDLEQQAAAEDLLTDDRGGPDAASLNANGGVIQQQLAVAQEATEDAAAAAAGGGDTSDLRRQVCRLQ